MARFLGKPVKPIANDKNVDPANIKAIIQEVLVAPSKDDLNVFKCFAAHESNEEIESNFKNMYWIRLVTMQDN